jgi:hypothetical protein
VRQLLCEQGSGLIVEQMNLALGRQFGRGALAAYKDFLTLWKDETLANFCGDSHLQLVCGHAPDMHPNSREQKQSELPYQSLSDFQDISLSAC